MTPIKKGLVLIAFTSVLILSVAALGVAMSPRFDHSNDNWPGAQILVTGSVNDRLSLTLSNSTTLTTVTVTAELVCVDRTSYGIHHWTGVRLIDILERAGVNASAMKVGFHASDGYTTDLTLEVASRQDVIIAFEEDGVPLKEKTRLVVPGMWGYKWISGIDQIRLYDFDFKGTYESRGYADDATMGT